MAAALAESSAIQPTYAVPVPSTATSYPWSWVLSCSRSGLPTSPGRAPVAAWAPVDSTVDTSAAAATATTRVLAMGSGADDHEDLP